MKYFYIKITAIALTVIALFTVCFKLAHNTTDDMTDTAYAYNLSSWLAKNNVTIDKDLIDTKNHKVVSLTLKDALENHEAAAASILGEAAENAGADTYKGKIGTVAFSGNSFTLTPDGEIFKSEIAKVDRYNMGKRAEAIAVSMGFDLDGSVILTYEDNDEYTAAIMKTANSLPIFNDCLTITVSGGKFQSAGGVWYIPDSPPTNERPAKSASDALAELLREVDGFGRVTVTAMTLGYKMEKNGDGKFEIYPFWKFELSDRDDVYIEA